MADDLTRLALAEVETQRDDAIAYLSTIREVLGVLARGHGLKPSAQGIAEALVRELAVESAVLIVRQDGDDLALVGFATQSQRLGGPTDAVGEAGWLALARLVGAGAQAACFRRTADGGFAAIAAADLAGEGFLVIPFPCGDEARGTLVLHWLVAPAQRFGRGPAMSLMADAVGNALTVAESRDTALRVSATLAEELGSARRLVSQQHASLRAREDSIEKLSQDLVRSNQAKREFLGTVSHELRTPLNAILGYSSLLHDGMVGDMTPDQRGLLERVVAASRNLNELIGDMIFFVQTESDRVVVRPQDVSTADVVEAAIGALRERPRAERVTLHTAIAPEVAALHADERLLRRILFHLVGNAVKFTTAGEVVVSASAADTIDGLVLRVRDTGPGIPPERLDELFEPFTQGDSTPTRRHDGLGMGLTLVQRCVKLLGGELAVDSQPGVGTEVSITLPGIVVRQEAHTIPQGAAAPR